MKNLKIISAFLQFSKWLLIAGGLFAIVFMLFYKEELVMIGSPGIHLKEGSLKNSLNQLLALDEHMRFSVKEIETEVPPTPQLKAAIIVSAILYVGYFLWILQIIINIVKDIRKTEAFKMKNIIRLKNIAWLIILAPILEGILQLAFTAYISKYYSLPEGLTFRSGIDFDFALLTLGLLLYAVAIAFNEGLKMKKEQELTI